MDELNATSTDASVYQHTAKAEWGAAVIAWEREGKRGYLFEDGELRIFKDGYYHLMAQVDVEAERAIKLFEAAQRAGAQLAASATPGKKKKRGITLDEMMDFFSASFPGGFANEDWKNEHRADSGRARKRHRDPAVAKAAEQLTMEKLSDGEPAKILAAVIKLIASTDLVSAAEARGLGKGDDASAAALIDALKGVLWGDGDLGPRFQAWISALTDAAGDKPSWMLATAPLTLAQPQDHVCVRHAPFRTLASSLAPGLQLTKVPHPSLYERTRAMAVRVYDKAKERELAPADMLDIYDFVRLVMSPKSRSAIQASRNSS